MFGRTAGVLWSTAMLVVAILGFLQNGHEFSLMSAALGGLFVVWLWYVSAWVGNRRLLRITPRDQAGDIG